MIRIRSGDPIVVMIEVTAVMLIIVSKRGGQQLMARDPVPARGHPDHPLDHTQEGEMPTLLPQREKKSVGNNHQDSQKNMINIGSGDPILLMIEMTAVVLIIVIMKCKVTALLHQRLRKSARQNHQESQKNITRIQRGDPMPLMIEMTAMMQLMVPEIAICMSTGSR